MGCELGETVGYSIRFEDLTSEKTLIKVRKLGENRGGVEVFVYFNSKHISNQKIRGYDDLIIPNFLMA